MSDAKKLGIPFLVIFIGALLLKVLDMYLSNIMTPSLTKIITVIILCLFGATLNISFHKRSKSVWKKVVAVLVVLFLLFMELGLFTFTSVSNTFSLFGVNALFIQLLYVFCGYVLVD